MDFPFLEKWQCPKEVCSDRIPQAAYPPSIWWDSSNNGSHYQSLSLSMVKIQSFTAHWACDRFPNPLQNKNTDSTLFSQFLAVLLYQEFIVNIFTFLLYSTHIQILYVQVQWIHLICYCSLISLYYCLIFKLLVSRKILLQLRDIVAWGAITPTTTSVQWLWH